MHISSAIVEDFNMNNSYEKQQWQLTSNQTKCRQLNNVIITMYYEIAFFFIKNKNQIYSAIQILYLWNQNKEIIFYAIIFKYGFQKKLDFGATVFLIVI